MSKERTYVFDPAPGQKNYSQLPMPGVVTVNKQGMQEILTLEDGTTATVELRGLRMVMERDMPVIEPVPPDMGKADVPA